MNKLAPLKTIIPKSARSFIKRVLAPYLLRRSWMVRKTSLDDDHLVTYWNAGEQPNRKQLISILKAEIDALSERGYLNCPILEYGSHVGLNLKLLGEQLGLKSPHMYFAIDPNQEAIAFLKEQLPMVHTFLGEDVAFCEQTDFPPPGEYLCFINSVFYSMESRRVKNVLHKLSKISKIIIIGESLSNVDGTKTKLRENPECFEHPYRIWLRDNGFEIAYLQVAADPKPQLNGYLVAYNGSNFL